MKNQYFPALTGIRAIACYMVYIVHTDPLRAEKYGQFIFDFLEEFQICLTIFFVLSGFLITHNYFDENKINFKRYLTNRFARIYPVYFLLTTATFIFFAITQKQYSINNFWIYLSNITFIRGFSEIYNFTGLGQGWTLTVEECFYLSAPFIFIIIKKNRIVGFLLPFFFLFIGFVLVNIFKNIDFFGFMKSLPFMIELTFFGRCFEFFFGIALALFIKQNKTKINFKQFTYFGILGIVTCIYTISTLKGNSNSGTSTKLGFFINTIILPIFGILPLFYGLITEKTIVSRILETKLFQLLGKSSYVFYLIHVSFIATFLYNSISNYILNFLILNVLAVFLYLFFEKPFHVYFKKLFLKR